MIILAVMRPIAKETSEASGSVKDHRSFGMWADRAEMADVTAYVKKIRTRIAHAV